MTGTIKKALVVALSPEEARHLEEVLADKKVQAITLNDYGEDWTKVVNDFICFLKGVQ